MLSGKDADLPSDRCCFTATAGVVLFDDRRLEARLRGMLMKN